MARCLIVFFMLISGSVLAMAQEQGHAPLAALVAQLEQRLETFQQQPAVTIRDLKLLEADLELLYQRVKRDSEVLVNRKGKQVTIESDGVGVFRQTPKLPPEEKRAGRWHFKPLLFEVVPRHLFVFAVRIKGDHTIRVRKVVLAFHDGTTRVFDSWLNEEDGNGRAFSRRSFGLDLNAWQEAEGLQARALKSIEILGSAQDAGHEAGLIFQFVIPDPSDRPYKTALRQLELLKSQWFKASPNAEQLVGYVADLHKLTRSLDLPSPLEK